MSSILAELRFRAGSAKRRLVGWKPYPDPVWPACALCGSEEREQVASRVAFEMRYRTVVCTDCGLVYLCPRPSEAAFADFYERLFPALHGPKQVESTGTARGDRVVSFIAESIDLGAHTGLFDVGCGGGGLLRSAARAPATASLRLGGCDPGWPGGRDEVLLDNGVRIEIFRQPVERLGGRLSAYSILVLYDVLEHLLDPRELLATLHEPAPSGAVLFISTNSLDNWAQIPRGGWERYYLRLAHTYTFGDRTLDALLRTTGWLPVRRGPAEKGDQWVLAVRGEPEPDAVRGLQGNAAAVRELIARYRAVAGR